MLPDATTVRSLGGQTVKLHTADGDAALTLIDSADRPLWTCNAQGTLTRTLYEAVKDGGRPIGTEEQPAGGPARLRERSQYAPADAEHRQRNLAGIAILMHDNAGRLQTCALSLTDQPLETRQRLLRPEADQPDWGGDSERELETQPLIVMAHHDALGSVLRQTNAAGVTTVTTYAVSGAVSETRLRHGADETRVLETIERRADGKVLSQTAGNGVVDTYVYSPRSRRLAQHRTERPSSHPLGALVICDLHYVYDPAGNILGLDDQGTDPEWHSNQEANGLREYRYDSLYRLVSATGRERASVSGYWAPAFAASDLKGGKVWRPYTEQYAYDDGDNLTVLSHNGGAGSRSRTLLVAGQSNRALPEGHGLTPETGFLPGGLQKQLSDGRSLQWLADNQLRLVTLVSRPAGETDDTERYHYADSGTRTRKVNTVTTSSGLRTATTTYGGGCETRQRWLDANLQKHIVITEADAVRWVEDRLNKQCHLRYGFSDHLDSVGGETDGDGTLVTREEYSPFGETTSLDEPASEVDRMIQRTARHSGKELDASGLYYYGYRYCEKGRWISADPGGTVDGVNLYRMVNNNPLRYRDNEGLAGEEAAADMMMSFFQMKLWLAIVFTVGASFGMWGLARNATPIAYSLATAYRENRSWRAVGRDFNRQMHERDGRVAAVDSIGAGLALMFMSIGFAAAMSGSTLLGAELGAAGVIIAFVVTATSRLMSRRIWDPEFYRARLPSSNDTSHDPNSMQMTTGAQSPDPSETSAPPPSRGISQINGFHEVSETSHSQPPPAIPSSSTDQSTDMRQRTMRNASTQTMADPFRRNTPLRSAIRKKKHIQQTRL
ncbi:RHS repeat-associated core domain-containing protein [Pseudomonas sp. NPDC089752]|uniref:RHS repeat-associated core domain-containing protein n=1 Tax=Pseudomonas sp. NPDC089752 TaxID=3364472 RepID=UPI0038242BC3